MADEILTIPRERAITLINDSIENFFIFYDSYCHDNKKNLSKEQTLLYDQMNEVMMIVKKDQNYNTDLKQMPLNDLKNLLLACKQMVELNDLSERFSYPKGEFVIEEEKKEYAYDPSWIIVKKDDGNIVKIINNGGNDITFVKTTGEIICKKLHTGSFTEFFGTNIGLSQAQANNLFIKAHYSWIDKKMQGGYKAFDLNGNEVEPTVDGNAIIVKKNEIKIEENETRKEGGSSVVQSKVSGRVFQNDLRPSNPNGPCLFRALIAAVEEKISKAFTLNEINKIKKECSKKDNKYIGNEEDEFFVNNHKKIIEATLNFAGYKNSKVTWGSRKSTLSKNSDYTIRYIASKKHFQLGDKDGNLLWEPYKYNNPNNAYIGKADSYNEITIVLGSKK